jgi:mono/diheme cytochrome c family protein
MPEAPRESRADVTSTMRWQVAGVVVLSLLVLAFPLYRATESSHRAEAQAQEDHALVTGGHHLFELNCSSCHGTQGEGVSAPALNSQQFLTGVTDEQIHGIVAGGVPGSAMPAWLSDYGGPLTDQEIQEVVTYLRSLEPHAPSRPDWRTPAGTTGGGP